MSPRPPDLPDETEDPPGSGDRATVELATSPALDEVESAAVVRAIHEEGLGPGEPGGRGSRWWRAGLLAARDRAP